MQLRGRRRVDDVGRPKFDFHTGPAATASSRASNRRAAQSSRRSGPAWRTRTTRSTSAARRRRRCTRRSRRRGELFAAHGGAAPRGLSIEVLLYLGRCGCLATGWLHHASEKLRPWKLGCAGAESAPRRVRSPGLALALEALCIAPARITVRRETSREVGREVGKGRCQSCNQSKYRAPMTRKLRGSAN